MKAGIYLVLANDRVMKRLVVCVFACKGKDPTSNFNINPKKQREGPKRCHRHYKICCNIKMIMHFRFTYVKCIYKAYSNAELLLIVFCLNVVFHFLISFKMINMMESNKVSKTHTQLCLITKKFVDVSIGTWIILRELICFSYHFNCSTFYNEIINNDFFLNMWK